MKKISIAIADDDSLVAKLLEDFFNVSSEYDVLFTVADGNELMKQLDLSSQTLPEIVLLDLKMPGMNGIDALQRLKKSYPSIKVIIISSYYQNSFTGFIFKTGGSAFIPKEISPQYLLEIIGTVYQHGIYMMREQVSHMREQISSKAPKPVFNKRGEFSKREIEILKLIGMQKTTKEIGEILFIAPKTVEGHKNNLFTKTGAKNVAGLLIYAIRNDVLNIEEFTI